MYWTELTRWQRFKLWCKLRLGWKLLHFGLFVCFWVGLVTLAQPLFIFLASKGLTLYAIFSVLALYFYAGVSFAILVCDRIVPKGI